MHRFVKEYLLVYMAWDSAHDFRRHRFLLTWLRQRKVMKDHVKYVIGVKIVASKRERNPSPDLLFFI